jgi:hypothetical protein
MVLTKMFIDHWFDYYQNISAMKVEKVTKIV